MKKRSNCVSPSPSAERLNPERRDTRPSRLKSGTAGMIEQADVNRRRALELRLPPHRLSYSSIARRLGVSRSTAHGYVNAAHGEILEDIAEKKAQLRYVENETVDLLIERWLPIALEPKNKEFGLRAVDRIVRLVEQRCRINGLFLEAPFNTEAGQEATIEREILQFVYDRVGDPTSHEQRRGDEVVPPNDKASHQTEPRRKLVPKNRNLNSPSSPNPPMPAPLHTNGAVGLTHCPPVPGMRPDITIIR